MFKNWRTALLGCGGIIAAIGDLMTQVGEGHFSADRLGSDLIGIFVGLGLLFARDAAVSEREHAIDRAQIDENTQEIERINVHKLHGLR